jgi:hypothetical protein
LSSILQKRPIGVMTPSIPQMKELNAETVTTVATSFLKRIGHKGGLKPKRVSLEEDTYTVEVEMKKLSAIVQVDAKSHEIKAYEIQAKGEEAPFLPVSVKAIVVVVGLAVGAQLGLNFALKMLGT